MNRQDYGALIIGAVLLFGAGCGTEPVEGASCKAGEKECDSDNRIFACNDMMKWVDQGAGDENACNCIEGKEGCAIVGYVGITTSGRARTAGIRLRA